MTSKERKEERYQKRKEQRLQKMRQMNGVHDDFDWVFSWEHLYKSSKQCENGVRWKPSVQKFEAFNCLNVTRIYKELQNGTYHSDGFAEFQIFERGKLRNITSVTIKERVVQKCLCDYCLLPILKKRLIYDNSACLKNRGYSFAIKRVTKFMTSHYKKYGTEGFALCCDYHDYFGSIPHKVAKDILKRYISDKRILKLSFHFIDCFKGDVGLGLGSQISQILALIAINNIDHYIKEKLRIKFYERYNDDLLIIHHSKKFLESVLKELKILSKQIGLELHPTKTKIVRLRHGFHFIKCRFFYGKNGKIIKKMMHKRHAYAIKKLRKLYNNERIKVNQLANSFQSVKGYYINFNEYYRLKRYEYHFFKNYGYDKFFYDARYYGEKVKADGKS